MHRLLALVSVVSCLLVACPRADDDDTTAAVTDDDDTTADDDDSTAAVDDDDTTADDDDTIADDDDTTADDDDSSQAIQPIGDWVTIACSSDNFCVLDSVGRPFCLMNGGTNLIPGPTQGIAEIAVVSSGACGLDASGMGNCWDESGAPYPLFPTIPQEPLFSLQSGCALRQSDGLPSCWWGITMPQQGGPWAQLFRRYPSGFGCLRGSGVAYCRADATPDQITLPGAYIDIVSNGAFICGLDAAGVITCEGENDQGALDPPTDAGWVDIAGYSDGLCARKTDGTVGCWGTFSNTPAPEPMRALCDAWGNGLICGISTSNAIRCWGDDVPINLQQYQ